MSKKLTDYSSQQIVASAQQDNRPALSEQAAAKPTEAHVDAVSQLFTELELSYHNQFHKAYPDHRSLTMAKQLWLRMLADIEPQHIVAGGRQALCSSDFLPTLNTVRKHCEIASLAGVPDPKAAYLEACHAGEPKQNVNWSHPIVYHAGKMTGWFPLKNQTESQTYPLFEKHYHTLTQRILRGEVLPKPDTLVIEHKKNQPLDPEEQKSRLAALRADLEL